MAQRHFEGKEQAVSYQRYRVSPPQELVAEIVGFLEKRRAGPLDVAVDVGCGSGQGTILLAPYFTQVVGTDISPAQLEVAMANSSVGSNVTYRQCPAEDLPFADAGADLVVSMTAAHWFDRPRFLGEAERVLRPGGGLALLSYTLDMELDHKEHGDELNNVCQELYAALLPYRIAYLGPGTRALYKQMYDACPYPDKEWHECLRVRRTLPVSGFVGLVETFSSYRALLSRDPAEASRLSRHVTTRLLSVLGTSSPDTEVVMVMKYFYWLACKPGAE